MTTDHPLRLYANPLKQLLYLLGAAGFTAIGIFIIGIVMLRGPSVRSAIFPMALAVVDVLFFGLGVGVSLVMLLRNTILRRPVLQVGARGWQYQPPLGGVAQEVPWENVAAVVVRRQRIPGGYAWHLAVYAKDPRDLPHPHVRAFSERFYPALAGVALTVPLNILFLRTTPAKGEQLLERISAACADEIRHHGVRVSHVMHAL